MKKMTRHIMRKGLKALIHDTITEVNLIELFYLKLTLSDTIPDRKI